MENAKAVRAQSKKHWVLTQQSLTRLLEWLDDGTDSGGARYLEVRNRLVAYFDRKNCLAPDELADETLNRVARRIEEEGAIITDAPAHFCYLTARYVLLETYRVNQRLQPVSDDIPVANSALDGMLGAEENDARENALRCLESCVAKLEATNRDLITQYYTGDARVKIDNRRNLADRLGITVNALTIRACRLRVRLEACVKECCARK